MIEIIPNWHPLVVHFTVALWFTSFVFYLLASFVGGDKLRAQWLSVARWNLWSGMLISILTVLAGWYAYNTVNHDTVSHAVMTEHRNLALLTFVLYLALAVWSYRNSRNNRGENILFLALLLAATLMLGSTAWHGGELVYRHGLGVMSMPDSGMHDHAGREHSGEAGHSHEGMQEGDADHHATDSASHTHDEADGHHAEERTDAHHHDDDGHSH